MQQCVYSESKIPESQTCTYAQSAADSQSLVISYRHCFPRFLSSSLRVLRLISFCTATMLSCPCAVDSTSFAGTAWKSGGGSSHRALASACSRATSRHAPYYAQPQLEGSESHWKSQADSTSPCCRFALARALFPILFRNNHCYHSNSLCTKILLGMYKCKSFKK